MYMSHDADSIIGLKEKVLVKDDAVSLAGLEAYSWA
jgi:hypothetical protein